MEFTCNTCYDRKALTAMSRAVRKTIRKKSSRLLHIYSWVVIALCLLSIWVSWGDPWYVALDSAVILLLLLVQLKEDALNAFFARRRAMPRLEDCDTCFYSDYYETRFPGSVTQWQYDRILHLAETSRYIILILGKTTPRLAAKPTWPAGVWRPSAAFWNRKPEKKRSISEDNGLYGKHENGGSLRRSGGLHRRRRPSQTEHQNACPGVYPVCAVHGGAG